MKIERCPHCNEPKATYPLDWDKVRELAKEMKMEKPGEWSPAKFPAKFPDNITGNPLAILYDRK